jgi:hypothetical protein
MIGGSTSAHPLALGDVSRAERHAPSGRPDRLVLHQVGVEPRQSLKVPLLGEDSVSNQCSVDVSATLVSRRSREASMLFSGARMTERARTVNSGGQRAQNDRPGALHRGVGDSWRSVPGPGRTYQLAHRRPYHQIHRLR